MYQVQGERETRTQWMDMTSGALAYITRYCHVSFIPLRTVVIRDSTGRRIHRFTSKLYAESK